MAKRSKAARAAQASARPAAPAGVPVIVMVLLGICVAALVATIQAQSQIDAVDAAAVMLGIAALVAAGMLVSRPALVVPRTRLGFAWTAFLVWALVSAVVSGRVWASLVGEVTNLLGWFSLLAVTVVVVGVSAYASSARRALEIAAPIVVFGEVAATIVELSLGDMPRGSLPNSTYLGQALLLVLPFVMVEDNGVLKLSRPQRLALGAATAVTLAAAGSRVAAVVAIAWFLWVLVGRSGLSRTVKIAALSATVLAFAVGALTFARAEVLGSTGVETLGARPQMWRTAALAVAERPLVGYGPDGFVAGGVAVTGEALARAGDALVFRPGAVDPHSLAVWVAVSTGVVGLALFLWALVELVLSWRARAAAGEDVAPAVFAVLGALAVFMTAPAALQVVPLLGFVLGTSLAPLPGREGAAADPRPAGIVPPVVLALMVAASLVFTANTATRFSLEKHSAQISPGRTGAAQAATDLWSLDPHLAHLASLHWGWAAASNPSIAAAHPDLRAIERAVAVDSRDPFVALEYARTLRFYGAAPADLERAFLEVFERWELFPLARAEYAVFLAQQGRADEAREQIEIAELVVEVDPQRQNAIDAAEELLGP